MKDGPFSTLHPGPQGLWDVTRWRRVHIQWPHTNCCLPPANGADKLCRRGKYKGGVTPELPLHWCFSSHEVLRQNEGLQTDGVTTVSYLLRWLSNTPPPSSMSQMLPVSACFSSRVTLWELQIRGKKTKNKQKNNKQPITTTKQTWKQTQSSWSCFMQDVKLIILTNLTVTSLQLPANNWATHEADTAVLGDLSPGQKKTWESPGLGSDRLGSAVQNSSTECRVCDVSF